MKKESISTKKVTSLDDIASEKALTGNGVTKFDVDPRLVRLFEEKGLAVRWISAPKFRQEGGHHNQHWIPLREEHTEAEGIDLGNSPYGQFNADGFFVRGTMLLAIRSLAKHQEHKKRNKTEAKRFKEKVKTDAEKLAGKIASQGGKLTAKIVDEY